jgi:4-amino-4-deoxy-L-arabinose transferase-like glycosyltransferase
MAALFTPSARTGHENATEANDGGTTVRVESSRGRMARLAFGRQARWVRPSAAAMLLGTAVLYLWNITISGYGNSFYAAAVQAGTKNWTALLFGSLDAGNAITVDKPPASLWIPALLGRVFGFSPATVLVPQALMGVAAVGLLYLAVKRTSGPAAGLIAGSALALTPVAALMFRFNNPDALLTLCLVAAAYATLRAIEKPGWKWLALAGAVIGLAFLTKMLQGFLIIPALGLAYLWAAPIGWWRRLAHLGAAVGGIVVVAGSYVALFQLTPAADRPYMAGSEHNSFLELTLGYNGLGRITGNEGGGAPTGTGAASAAGGLAGGAGGGNASFGGATGILRMFGASFGAEVSWLLPAALLLMVALFWLSFRSHRTSLLRASAIVWGGWLLLTAGIFSFMSGIIHPYYTVALAPAIAALVGIGGVELWRRRSHWTARATLAAAVLGSSVWSAALLSRDAQFLPWLKFVVVVLGVLAAAGIVFRADKVRRGAAVVVIASLLASGLGSTTWALATVSVAHTGSIPTSGPASAAGGGFGGAAGGGARPAGTLPSDSSGARPGGGAGGPGDAPDGGSGGGFGGGAPPTGAGPGGTDAGTGQGTGAASGTTPAAGGAGAEAGGANAALTALLAKTTTKWSAIVSGATEAASLELATNTSVIALGGWNGSDPYPTLAEFKTMVADGQISYFISGGMGGGRAGSSSTGETTVASWVAANFTAQSVGGTTVYKLIK